MNGLWHQFELLLTAALGIVMAILADIVRTWHEHEQGKRQFKLALIPFSILRGLLMGVIAVSFAQWAHEAYQLPELAGGALGGILGYLGPTAIPYWFERLSALWLPSKKKGDGE